jgi:hypothetical protein
VKVAKGIPCVNSAQCNELVSKYRVRSLLVSGFADEIAGAFILKRRKIFAMGFFAGKQKPPRLRFFLPNAEAFIILAA